MARQDSVHGGANKVVSEMEAVANQMTLFDGSAASKLNIVVEKDQLTLAPAFGNPNTKFHGTGRRRSDAELPPTLSVDAMVTAQGSTNEDGVTKQTEPKRFECDVSYDGEDWECVERKIDVGTLVADVSQPDTTTEASHAAYK
jgi:hypothetical protein